ncbi:MAG: hypothetical protein E6J91_13050 [Deltaproteobacteria bacterium]|nr:MAG: hypothetical protein E6J91_13050 [Deltaproteobacteria bacterium]
MAGRLGAAVTGRRGIHVRAALGAGVAAGGVDVRRLDVDRIEADLDADAVADLVLHVHELGRAHHGAEAQRRDQVLHAELVLAVDRELRDRIGRHAGAEVDAGADREAAEGREGRRALGHRRADGRAADGADAGGEAGGEPAGERTDADVLPREVLERALAHDEVVDDLPGGAT